MELVFQKINQTIRAYIFNYKTASHRTIPALLLFILGIAVYAPSFGNEMFWDDNDFILNNGYVQDLKQFPKYFTENVIAGSGLVSNYWRPVLLTVFAFEWQLFGEKVIGWHFVSTAAHSLDAAILFLLLYELFKKRLLAFIAALIFLVHPVQTESVVYVNSMGDSLSVLFMLLGLFILARTFAKAKLISAPKKWLLLGTVSGCYILAQLSKETAIIMPALAVLVALFSLPYKKITNQIKHALLITLPLWIIALAYIILRATAANFKNSFNLYDQSTIFSESLIVRLYTFIKALWIYIGLIFWPNNLHMERALEPVLSLGTPSVIFGLLGLMLIAYLIVSNVKKSPVIAFGLLWFFIAFAPTSNILIPINGVIYEHWLYVPVIGVAACIAYAFTHVWEKFTDWRAITAFLMLAILISLSVRSIKRMGEWGTAIRFYEQTLKFAPDSYRVTNNLAMAYADDGKTQKAISLYATAITLDPTVAVAFHNRANAYGEIGNYNAAITDYEQALLLDPNFIFSYGHLIKLYIRENRMDSALQILSQYVTRWPEDRQARRYLQSLQAEPAQ